MVTSLNAAGTGPYISLSQILKPGEVVQGSQCYGNHFLLLMNIQMVAGTKDLHVLMHPGLNSGLFFMSAGGSRSATVLSEA